MTIEEASGAVGGDAEQARELAESITASKGVIEQLASATSALGLETKANAADAIGQEAETLAGQAAALADALDQLQAKIEALNGLLTNGNATPTTRPVPTAPASVVKGTARSGVKPPNAQRHLLRKIGKYSQAKVQNTVILPSVDVEADLNAIRTGRARWNPQTSRYEINGRLWGVKDNGTAFPDSGPGLVNLSRGEYKALVGLIEAGGDMDRRPPKLARDRYITASDWERAAAVYRYHPRNDQRER